MEDATEALGVKFKFRRDPNIPDGSVWQSRRFFNQYMVVGYSGVCDSYHIQPVHPSWAMEIAGKVKPGMVDRKWFNSMKRVS